MTTPEPLLARARALQLHGVVSHWTECAQAPWIAPLIEWEETERARRSLERRLRCAHIGRFKPLADFDWRWPEQCDQAAIAELMTLGFLETATNALLVGPPGSARPPSRRTSPTRRCCAAHRALHHRRPAPGRARRARLRLGAAPPPAPLRQPHAPGDRRGRLPLLLEPPRRSALRAHQPSPREKEHPHHHQQVLRRMVRGVPQRRLRGRAHRPPGPSRRDHRPQGQSWRHKEAQERAATNARKRKSARSPA